MGATTMDDGKFMQLLNINWELIEICKWLKENQNTTLESMIVPITDELTQLVLELNESDSGAGHASRLDHFAFNQFAKALMRQL
jgi:hypothetical protein